MKYEIMIKILFELLAKKCVSAGDLAEKYEISRRTVYRYIECLEAAGVPLYTRRGKDGGFSIVDTYKLSACFMTKTEFETVISTLITFNKQVPSSILDGAIKKLQATVKNDAYGFEIKSGNLFIDGGPWGDTVSYKSKIKAISEAIEKEVCLEIKYHDRGGEKTTRIIEPHSLVLKQGLWYVYAFCRLRQEFRLFKTGRIEYANVTKQTFKRREIGFNLSFSAWYETVDTLDVVMEVDKSIVSDIEEWLGIENVFLNASGKITAAAKLPFDSGLVSKILSFGGKLKVVKPSSLKEQLINSAKEIIKNYSDE